MNTEWRQHGHTHGLYLGSLTLPVARAERTEGEGIGGHLYSLHWYLHGHQAPFIAELPDVKRKAEQLLDLWLLRAELSSI